MKKSIIALSIISTLAAAPTMAKMDTIDETVTLSELNNAVQELHDRGFQYDTTTGAVKNFAGETVANVSTTEHGISVVRESEGTRKLVKHDVIVLDDSSFGENTVIIDDTNRSTDENLARIDSVKAEIEGLVMTGNKVKIGDKVIDRENYEEFAKAYFDASEDDKIEAAKELAKNIENGTVEVNVESVPLPDVEKAERDANHNAINNIRKDMTEAEKVVAKEYTSAAKHVAKQDARISTLEQDFSKMAERQDALEKRVDKVEKKMDSVMAGVHAVTNARPFVQNGQTAVGVGTGFAGSAQSVAIGAAHSFDDSAWSMSASMNVTTGSGVKTDVSGGVGAHYVF